jgi:hypothetical protein
MSDDQDRHRRLRAALRDIYWSAEALSGVTGMRSNTVRRIVTGVRPISDRLLVWLEDLAAYHRAHPPPPPPPDTGSSYSPSDPA